MLGGNALHEFEDLLRRNLWNIRKRSVDSFHGQYLESRLGEIAGKDGVHLLGKIAGADEFLDAQGAQRAHMILPGREHLNAVFLFPIANDRLLAFVAEQHKRWRAARPDQIRVHLRQLRRFRFVPRHRGAKLLFGAAGEIHCAGDKFDLGRDLLVEIDLLARFRSISRSHGADYVFFLGFRHHWFSFRFTSLI